MLSNEIKAEVRASVDVMTPSVIVEAIATQLKTARDARARIEEEGTVVRDMGGRVIPHPAIKIEADAIKLYADLIKKHQKRLTKGR